MNIARTYWKPVVAGLIGVAAGVIIWQVGSHLWTDHQTLHQIVYLINQNSQAAGAAK